MSGCSETMSVRRHVRVDRVAANSLPLNAVLSIGALSAVEKCDPHHEPGKRECKPNKLGALKEELRELIHGQDAYAKDLQGQLTRPRIANIRERANAKKATDVVKKCEEILKILDKGKERTMAILPFKAGAVREEPAVEALLNRLDIGVETMRSARSPPRFRASDGDPQDRSKSPPRPNGQWDEQLAEEYNGYRKRYFTKWQWMQTDEKMLNELLDLIQNLPRAALVADRYEFMCKLYANARHFPGILKWKNKCGGAMEKPTLDHLEQIYLAMKKKLVDRREFHGNRQETTQEKLVSSWITKLTTIWETREENWATKF